jgi:Holliday junction resolvase RusA-like endonuclease
MTATTAPAPGLHPPQPQEIAFAVLGVPGPQGSKTAFVNKHTGRAQMVESSAKVKPWREAVMWAALGAAGDTWEPLDGPLYADMLFAFARPASHFGTGRNAGTLKASAPRYPAVYPDLSKIIRSTEDALTAAGIWRDDSRLVHVDAAKVYTGGVWNRKPGAYIRICRAS